MVKSVTGKKHLAIDIFAMTLEYLKDHLLDAIRNTPEAKRRYFQFVTMY